MAAIRRALEEEFDAVGEEGHACEAEMEECVGGAYGPDDDADEGSSDSDSDDSNASGAAGLPAKDVFAVRPHSLPNLEVKQCLVGKSDSLPRHPLLSLHHYCPW